MLDGQNCTQNSKFLDENVQITTTILKCIYAALFLCGSIGNFCVMMMIIHIFITLHNSTKRAIHSGGPLNSSYHIFIYVLALSTVDFFVCAQLPILIYQMH